MEVRCGTQIELIRYSHSHLPSTFFAYIVSYSFIRLRSTFYRYNGESASDAEMVMLKYEDNVCT